MISDHADPLPHRAGFGWFSRAMALLLAISPAACSETRTDEVPGSANVSAAPGLDARASQDGSFEYSGTSYPFRIVRCDLTGQLYDGMILHGAGTAPDGRRLAVSVDRTGSDVVHQNAFVSFGDLKDGDNWSASRTSLQDGRWFADEGATEPADGPLFQIAGNELFVAATFHRESDDVFQPGVLRATCRS